MEHILASNILDFKEDVEEITEGADKQLGIETKLNDIKEMWSRRSFEFMKWKSRDVVVLQAFSSVVEDLEDAQLQLQTLLSMRHVGPFRDEVQLKPLYSFCSCLIKNAPRFARRRTLHWSTFSPLTF